MAKKHKHGADSQAKRCLMLSSRFSDKTMSDAEIDALYQLLDILARKLGYDNVLIRSANGKEAKPWKGVLERHNGTGCETADMKTASGHAVCIDSVDENGKIVSSPFLYQKIAKEIYKILDRGEAVYIDGQKLDADMVPEFMVKGALLLDKLS